MKALQLNAITDGTITEPGALLTQLAAEEASGLTHTVGEGVADVAAVACPLNLDGISDAVAVAGPAARIDPAIPALLEVIKRHLVSVGDQPRLCVPCQIANTATRNPAMAGFRVGRSVVQSDEAKVLQRS